MFCTQRYYCSGSVIHSTEHSIFQYVLCFAECKVIAIRVVLDSNPQLGTVCCPYNRFCEHVTGTSLHHFRQCWPRGTTALSLLPPLHKPVYSTAFDTQSMVWNFLGAFEKISTSDCSFCQMCVHPSVWNNSASAGRIFIKVGIWVFFELHLKFDDNIGWFTRRSKFIYNIWLNYVYNEKCLIQMF